MKNALLEFYKYSLYGKRDGYEREVALLYLCLCLELWNFELIQLSTYPRASFTLSLTLETILSMSCFVLV
jgi:hypothetical protein